MWEAMIEDIQRSVKEVSGISKRGGSINHELRGGIKR